MPLTSVNEIGNMGTLANFVATRKPKAQRQRTPDVVDPKAQFVKHFWAQLAPAGGNFDEFQCLRPI